ncbi:MAG TPA: acyl-CoA dehydrogenase, partial [Gammaproteobacteria bacterium]|nr:acyl-CoA dehydrogenase [Gammaproteobacteria bacterium]
MTALEAFRDSTRTWLEENCPSSMRTPMVPEEIVWGGRDAEYVNPESKLWLDRMGEKGWTCPTWPQEYGGGGLSKEEAAVLKDELGRIGARI